MRLLGLRQNISNVPFRTIQEDYDKAEDTLLLNIQKWTYIEQYLKKVPYWNELRRDYAEEMDLKVVPYSFRNSWNTRAKALGIPDGVVSRAFGNTEATNLRSYRQSTDQLTRNAFRDALGR